ncbi:hypothetical protein AB0F17_51235 [Nonomuraea sp. NPDC026600]|uniref:hypothetical protein n=1 Tax=Nonomuraea sp. NPDC026600 TaxID=3155363 RepID=UPI0033D8CC4A
MVLVPPTTATHDLPAHLEGLNTTHRTVRCLVGWMITELDEQAIAMLPRSDMRRPTPTAQGT